MLPTDDLEKLQQMAAWRDVAVSQIIRGFVRRGLAEEYDAERLSVEFRESTAAHLTAESDTQFDEEREKQRTQEAVRELWQRFDERKKAFGHANGEGNGDE